MINLYEYYKATRDECIDDLYEVLKNISNFDDYDTIRKKSNKITKYCTKIKKNWENKL